MNTSGRSNFKNCLLDLGIPFFRHSETEAGFISHNFATKVVPPKSSIILESVIGRILGIPNYKSKGIPKFK
jgi:hypothetical protein